MDKLPKDFTSTKDTYYAALTLFQLYQRFQRGDTKVMKWYWTDLGSNTEPHVR